MFHIFIFHFFRIDYGSCLLFLNFKNVFQNWAKFEKLLVLFLFLNMWFPNGIKDNTWFVG